jgi:hypothetical protein
VQVATAKPYVRIHPVDPVGFRIKTIIAQFIHYIHHDEHAGSKSYGQAKNIDGRITLILPQIAESDFQIISEHNQLF